MTPSGIVTLLSDFGSRDGYVGALKGALLARFPAARLVDLAHELEPGDVAAASFALAQAAPLFPAGTVHLAVVDPGVGSARRGLALACGSHCYVAPDNGLLSGVIEQAGAGEPHARALENAALWRAPVSPVFHGRDVFAPVAAHLAAGGALDAVGPRVDAAGLVRLPERAVEAREGALHGRVVHVDRFGNLVTDLASADARGVVEAAGLALPLRRTYSDVAPGALVALVGSSGRIEIAANGASAARVLGAGVGLVVTLRAPRESV